MLCRTGRGGRVVFCISTSQRVLRTLFAGRNQSIVRSIAHPISLSLSLFPQPKQGRKFNLFTECLCYVLNLGIISLILQYEMLEKLVTYIIGCRGVVQLGDEVQGIDGNPEASF